MKTPILTALLSLAFAVVALAGGVTGRVTDGSGNGKSAVTITVKAGGQSTTVSTDKDGYYTVELPPSAAGLEAKVYARGKYAATCTVPSSGGYARVNVKFK